MELARLALAFGCSYLDVKRMTLREVRAMATVLAEQREAQRKAELAAEAKADAISKLPRRR